MATIGQPLTSPEIGWKRIENGDPLINMLGAWTTSAHSSYSGGSSHYTTSGTMTRDSHKVKFAFMGSKIRLISTVAVNSTSDCFINIDGVEYSYSEYATSTLYNILNFEKLDLVYGKHTVEITSITNSAKNVFYFDAMDIDSSGYLIQMAEVGLPLTAPEAGWKRYDDMDISIAYTGTWTTETNLGVTNYHNGTSHISNIVNSKMKFKFSGTKIRIITPVYSNKSTAIPITIDGVTETFNQYSVNTQFKTLVYEKQGLSNGEHVVEITVSMEVVGKNVQIDAIDIDDTGRLIHPDEVTDIKDLTVGKRIRCHYQATSNAVGTFSGLGKETSDSIPVTSSATPNGDFYFIMVEDLNKKKILIADRNIQNNISWDVLNTSGIASGSGLPTLMKSSDIFTTSNLSARGHSVTASEVLSSLFPAYRAFDGIRDNGSCWAISPNKPGWLSYKFDSPKQIIGYKIFPNSVNTTQSPKSWTFEGSDDGTTWTTLDTQVNQINWSSFGLVFNYINNRPYLHYRINVSAFGGATDASSIGEMELFEGISGFSFTTRLLTGGVTNTDKDNEWDKYVVNSTLNGTITAGDNLVWNWNGGYSLTSTTNTFGSVNRTVRGNGSSAFNSYGVTSTGYSFRPVLLIDSTPLNKSFILFNGEYKKLVEGSPILTPSPINAIPKMTSNTAPSGVASASSIYNTDYDAWKAFDANSSGITNRWTTPASSKTGWLRYDFGSGGKVIVRYSVKGIDSPNVLDWTLNPKDWAFEGSNDGMNWTILDTQVNQVNWTQNEKKEYLFTNNVSYQKYRINIVANNGASGISISHLEMFEVNITYQPSSWQTISTTLPSVDTFKSEGMDDLSVFDRKSTIVNIPMDDNGTSGSVLGGGKLFKEKIDLKKYFEITSINVK